MPNNRYIIRRFYFDDERNGEIIKRGLTLEEAQTHCKDESTRYQDETGQTVWFDGYDKETIS